MSESYKPRPLSVEAKKTPQPSPRAIERNGENYYSKFLYKDVPKSTEDLAFFSKAALQAKNNHYNGRFMKGPYTVHFDNVMQGIQKDLDLIMPGLSPDVLVYSRYRTVEAQESFSKIIAAKQSEAYHKLYADKPARLETVARSTFTEDRHHTIAPGILDTPVYSAQIGSKLCANATFRMIYEGVTGKHISEEDLQTITACNYGDDVIGDPEYLKIFETHPFRQKYGNVQSLLFTGMNLDEISKTATKLKTKRPDAKIFVTINLKTETLNEAGIQHRAVLLGADTQNVTLHDPSPGHHGAFRNIPKVVFMRRWAATQNGGYLVIASQ